MSEKLAPDSLTHYDAQHIQVRRDFIGLCAYDKADFNQGLTKNGKKVKDEPNQVCMAMILRLLETLTDHERENWFLKAERLRAKGLKPPSEPKEYRIDELAYSTIIRRLNGTYAENTVRNSIAVLIQRGYIQRYQKTKGSIPDYVLNVGVVQKALNKQAQEAIPGEISDTTLEENRGPNSTPTRPNSTPTRPNSTPTRPNSTPTRPNSTPSKKEENNDNKIESKNDDRAESTPPSDQKPEESSPPSSIPSQSSSQESPPAEEPKQEIKFTQAEESVYALAEKRHLTHLKRDGKHKENCAKLAEAGVTTLEKLESLMQFCRQKPHLAGKALNLKNLINELNGWLQLQLPPDKQKSPVKITVGNMYLQPISSLPRL